MLLQVCRVFASLFFNSSSLRGQRSLRVAPLQEGEFFFRVVPLKVGQFFNSLCYGNLTPALQGEVDSKTLVFEDGGVFLLAFFRCFTGLCVE